MNISDHTVIKYLTILLVCLAFQASYAEQAENDKNTYLQVARTQLNLAFENYNKGDVEEARENLKHAKKWLDQAVNHTQLESVKQEAQKLSSDIQDFRLTMNEPGEKNDLVRFWHQSASMIKREAEQLMHGYTELTNENHVMRQLLDAQMHLYIAEHDFFVSHHSHDAVAELKNVLGYLDQAESLARPELKVDIKTLESAINDLILHSEGSHMTSKQDVLMRSLETVMENLNQAEAVASPQTRMRLEDIRDSVSELKKDTKSTCLKDKYDDIMQDIGLAMKKI